MELEKSSSFLHLQWSYGKNSAVFHLFLLPKHRRTLISVIISWNYWCKNRQKLFHCVKNTCIFSTSLAKIDKHLFYYNKGCKITSFWQKAIRLIKHITNRFIFWIKAVWFGSQQNEYLLSYTTLLHIHRHILHGKGDFSQDRKQKKEELGGFCILRLKC